MTTLFGLFHLYGFIIGAGVLVGIWIIERMSAFFGMQKKWLDEVIPFILIGAVIGARLYHLATDWQLYTHTSLIDLIAIWRGGIGFIGGLLGGFIGLILFIWFSKQLEQKLKSDKNVKQQIPNAKQILNIQIQRNKTTRLFVYLDMLSFGIPVAQAIGRLGNYVNKELYGLPTRLPWAIVIDGKRYHPLFLYEALANLTLFLFLLMLARRRSLALGKGQYMSLYVFGYAFIRFWLEFLRIETARFTGPLGIFSIAQWVTLSLMCVAALVFWTRRHAVGVPKSEMRAWDFSLK